MEAYWGKNGTRTQVIENILKPDGNRISAQVDYEYDDLYRLTHEHRIAYGGGDAGVAFRCFGKPFPETARRTDFIRKEGRMEAYWGKNGTRTRVIENILKPDGNRISAQVDYEYDNLYRLTHEHRIAYNGGNAGVTYEYNFVYDGAGNRTSWQVVGGSTTSYQYDAANKMTSPGTFTYDNKGNTSTIASGGVTTTYTWDLLNRMTQWSKTGQTTQDYVYNADGMRVRKTPYQGTATNFLLDGTEIAEEITGSTATAYVGPGLISKISGTTRTIYHADGIGSTRATTNGSEAVQEAAIYDAYGNAQSGFTTASNFGYAGQWRYYGDSTGLDYLKARYYDPAVGRFVSRDPIGYKGGLNLYGYTYDNPVNAIDPDGRLGWGILLPVYGIGKGIAYYFSCRWCNQYVDRVMKWTRYCRSIYSCEDTQARWRCITETADWENMIYYCGKCSLGSYTGPSRYPYTPRIMGF